MKIPAPLRPFYNAWMKVSHAIGLVMSKILLTIFWVLIFGIYGIISMIFVRKKSDGSHWMDAHPADAATMRNQF